MSLEYVSLFSTIIPSFLIAYLGILIFLHDRRSVTNVFFSLISLVSVLWSIANYISLHVTDGSEVLFWSRMVLFFAVPHVFLFLAFTYNFPSTKLQKPKILILLIVIATLVMITTLSPYVFSSIQMTENGAIPQPGPLIPFFAIAVLSSLLSGLFITARKYARANDNEKKQWRAMLIGTALSYILIIITNFVLVVGYQDTSYLKFGPIFMLPTIIGMGYAILKYKLLNVKAIATEILTLVMLSLSLLEAFMAGSNQELAFRLTLFAFYSVFGILIIQSVLKEVKQREYIEKLAGDLALTNDRLKFANERLKELDKQKTEFVSIASHQLRSPLTAIKGYSSMLLEGSFGEFPTSAKEAVDRIFQSSQKLVSVIEDFLNITRIELGRMKYELVDFDLAKLAEQVVGEQGPMVQKRGLKISFESDNKDHNVYADSGKINQVLNNVIDNAIKYTKEGGIAVRVENITNSSGVEVVRFISKDTGVGIDKDTMPKLFEKFVRAYDAGKTNIIGTGLGLYVAKQIVEGLNGKIWAESEGKGKGSTFIVEFPHTKLGEPHPVITAPEETKKEEVAVTVDNTNKTSAIPVK